jgi:hypothetical protein
MHLEVDIKQLYSIIQNYGECEAVNMVPFFSRVGSSAFMGWSIFRVDGKKIVDMNNDSWNSYKGKFKVNITVNPYNHVEFTRTYTYNSQNVSQGDINDFAKKYKEQYEREQQQQSWYEKPREVDYGFGPEFQDETKELSRMSKTEGKTLYRKLSKKYHPDTTLDPNGEDKFKIINQIYNS